MSDQLAKAYVQFLADTSQLEQQTTQTINKLRNLPGVNLSIMADANGVGEVAEKLRSVSAAANDAGASFQTAQGAASSLVSDMSSLGVPGAGAAGALLRVANAAKSLGDAAGSAGGPVGGLMEILTKSPLASVAAWAAALAAGFALARREGESLEMTLVRLTNGITGWVDELERQGAALESLAHAREQAESGRDAARRRLGDFGDPAEMAGANAQREKAIAAAEAAQQAKKEADEVRTRRRNLERDLEGAVDAETKAKARGALGAAGRVAGAVGSLIPGVGTAIAGAGLVASNLPNESPSSSQIRRELEIADQQVAEAEKKLRATAETAAIEQKLAGLTRDEAEAAIARKARDKEAADLEKRRNEEMKAREAKARGRSELIGALVGAGQREKDLNDAYNEAVARLSERQTEVNERFKTPAAQSSLTGVAEFGRGMVTGVINATQEAAERDKERNKQLNKILDEMVKLNQKRFGGAVSPGN